MHIDLKTLQVLHDVDPLGSIGSLVRLVAPTFKKASQLRIVAPMHGNIYVRMLSGLLSEQRIDTPATIYPNRVSSNSLSFHIRNASRPVVGRRGAKGFFWKWDCSKSTNCHVEKQFASAPLVPPYKPE
jgi:hypothetical protein